MNVRRMIARLASTGIALLVTAFAGCTGPGNGPDASPACDEPPLACARSSVDVYSVCGTVIDVQTGEPVVGREQLGLRVEIHAAAAFPDSLEVEPEIVATLDACGRYRAIDFPYLPSVEVVARDGLSSTDWVPSVRYTATASEMKDNFDVFALSTNVDQQWSEAVFGEAQPGFADRGTSLFILQHEGTPAPGVEASTPGLSFPDVSYLTGENPQERWLPDSSPPTRANGSVLVTNDVDRIDFSGGEPPGCEWTTHGGFDPSPGYVQTQYAGALCQ